MVEIHNLFEELIADVDTALLFEPNRTMYEKYKEAVNTVIISVKDDFGADLHIELPIEFQDTVDLFRFGITGALDKEFIGENDIVICAAKLFATELDTISRAKVTSEQDSKLYDFFGHSRAEQSVIKAVLELAIGLGKSGQKGQPVGALFSIGDAGTVMNSSRSLSYNPFDQSHVHAGDPIVDVMLKEFSRLDGAFVISDAGKIVSAYQYLEPSITDLEIPNGLGTRHSAAAAITSETDAVTIVLSEGDSRVRGFKSGDLIFDIDPKQY